MPEHSLTKVREEFERGWCNDPECCPDTHRFFAVCSCGWESGINYDDDDAKWDFQRHAEETTDDA